MKISVASGKGGTGKTTVAVNLTLSLDNAQLLDCDVEEPDCRYFLNLKLEDEEIVRSFLPVIDDEKCNLCRECVEMCHWNAIVVTPQKAMVFPELCHGCGLCARACPQNAILERGKVIGKVQKGRGEVDFYQGILKTGELLSPLVIRAVKRKAKGNKIAIIDAPPGNACSAAAAVEETDFCLLVTEPTPFGLHDLKFSVRMINELGIPHAVLVNRIGIGDNRVEDYCRKEDIPVLMSIPNSRKIANFYSRGIPFVKEMPEWRKRFAALYEDIMRMVT